MIRSRFALSFVRSMVMWVLFCTPVLLLSQENDDISLDEDDWTPRKHRSIAFKVDPVLAICGDYPLFAEVRLKPKWSLEFAGGFTHRDGIWHLFNDSPLKRPDSHFKPEDGIIEDLNRNSWSGRFGIRFYLQKHTVPLGGSYVQLGIMHKQYLFVAHQVSFSHTGFLLSPSIPERRDITDIQLILGKQAVTANGPLVADFYTGIGIRSWHWYFAEAEAMSDNDNGHPITHWNVGVNHSYGISPIIYMGLKVGLGI